MKLLFSLLFAICSWSASSAHADAVTEACGDEPGMVLFTAGETDQKVLLSVQQEDIVDHKELSSRPSEFNSSIFEMDMEGTMSVSLLGPEPELAAEQVVFGEVKSIGPLEDNICVLLDKDIVASEVLVVSKPDDFGVLPKWLEKIYGFLGKERFVSLRIKSLSKDLSVQSSPLKR